MVVDMGLDIPDAALRRRAVLNAPRIRDALRTALANYSSVYYRVHTAPSPTELTRQMQSQLIACSAHRVRACCWPTSSTSARNSNN
jgi:hypothetical protein